MSMKQIAKIAFIVLALLSGLWARSADAGEKIYKEVLPNGLTVYVCPALASPTVSLNIFVKVGGFEEGEETSGISHFYEHLFFRGTKTLTGYKFKRAIESLGGATNAVTGRDFTHFFIDMPNKYAVQGIKLLADALINTELDPEAIDQERKAVLEELRLGTESPSRIIMGRIYEMAYPDHPYGRPVIGTEENIREFKRDDFVKFRDTYHTPDRITVIVAGDVSVNEIMPAIRDSFGNFTRPRTAPILKAPHVKAPAKIIRAQESLPMPSSFVVLGYLGPSVKDRPDIYRVDVLSFLLGIGRGSKLNRELVDKGQAMSVGTEFLTQRFPGLISVIAITKPGNEKNAEIALISAINEVREGKFTDKDLRRAKNCLRGSYLLDKETNSGKAGNLGFYASIDDASFTDSYLQQIDKVTREDVMAAAEKYMGKGYYCLTVMGHDKKQSQASEEENARKRRDEDEDRRPRRSRRIL
ncbi:MAG: insulinase family protein [bacterium]|nr:insulinase family protein [bacterium]